MTYSVFDSNNKKDSTKVNCFFDDPVTIARYDRQKYPYFEKLIGRQLGFFWRPEEVDVYRDIAEFKSLQDHEQHIFTSNLKRQILLDSVQGRSPNMAFLPIVSLPELETWIQTWAFSETIHSRSYTHIIRNIYANPSKIFDEMLDIQEIVDCAKDISDNYDQLIVMNTDMTNPHNPYEWTSCNFDNPLYEHKKALWNCLMAVNILEGLRFYASFACSWAFAEQKKMEGNAKIIKFICRDENLHLASTQYLLKILPQEDPDFAEIREETKDVSIKMFSDAAIQEKKWAEYLFQHGSMIGLNYEMLCDFVEYICNKRMSSVGLEPIFKGKGKNPLPWVDKWIAGSEVQVAPQEVAISSYVVGAVRKDVSDSDLSKMSL